MRSLFKEHSVELQYAMEAQASLITFRNDVVVKWRGVGLMCLSGDAHIKDGSPPFSSGHFVLTPKSAL